MVKMILMMNVETASEINDNDNGDNNNINNDNDNNSANNHIKNHNNNQIMITIFEDNNVKRYSNNPIYFTVPVQLSSCYFFLSVLRPQSLISLYLKSSTEFKHLLHQTIPSF